MKKNLLLAFLLSAMVSMAYAQCGKPAGWRASIASLDTVRTFKKCSYRIADFPGHGNYSDGAYTFFGGKPYTGAGFEIDCRIGASQDDIDGQLGAKLVQGKWIFLDFNEPFTTNQHFHVFKLAGANWTGTGVTYDATTGDEDTRPRFFQYCLVETRGRQVLCGRTNFMTVGAPPSTSTLPGILTVLKTIEFVDLPSVAPASASSTSSHLSHP